MLGICIAGFMGIMPTGTILFVGTKAGAAAEGFWPPAGVWPWKDFAFTFHFYRMSPGDQTNAVGLGGRGVALSRLELGLLGLLELLWLLELLLWHYA